MRSLSQRCVREYLYSQGLWTDYYLCYFATGEGNRGDYLVKRVG